MRKRAMMSEERRNKIKNSLRITRERRKTQDVIILKLKIDNDDIVRELLDAKEVISTTKKPKHDVDYLAGEYNGKLIYTYAKK